MIKEKKKVVSIGLLAAMITSMGTITVNAATPENTTSESAVTESESHTKEAPEKTVENHWYKGSDGKWHEKESYVGEHEKQKKVSEEKRVKAEQTKARVEAKEISLTNRLERLIDSLIRQVDSFNNYIRSISFRR